jgi:HAD superfamily hydrolase (TIGR01509 family)
VSPDAIIFDFDGVIADSEILSARLFSRFLTGIGLACTPDEAHVRYFGLNRQDALASMAAEWGESVPVDIAEQMVRHIDQAQHEPVLPIAGLHDFLAWGGHLPRAIASSNASAHISAQLVLFGIADHFGEHIYSGREHVSRGKPHPDLYLHAAAALGIDPARMLVIEDSPVGVRAAVAAGAEVIGLCAGGHCRPDHADRLLGAGAHHVAPGYSEIVALCEGRAARSRA